MQFNHIIDFPETANRFIRYAKIDTQSDPYSISQPSTEKQKDLARLLHAELQAAGIESELDEHGYVYATIPATSSKNIPCLCFCSHVDTAPDCSGTDVRPILHKNYKGQDLILPDDLALKISPLEFPYLNEKIGDDIITASGLTLLGSDDKSGVTAIMEAAMYLIKHPEIEHGKIRILFTPDEEIGRGVDKVDMKKLNADFGYTMDSGELGCLEDETFSADACTIEITGVSTHPGYAKGKMESAIKIASEIIARLPKNVLSPESTESYEGFVHPTKLEAQLESAKIDFIIRDFKTENLNKHVEIIKKICDEVIALYPNSKYKLHQKLQYRNMKEILVQYPHVVDYAIEAFKEANISLKHGKIRGGTDGSRLSFMGLPCPNLFAGEQGIHSKKEWVSVQDMQKAAEVIIRICSIYERYA